MTKVSKEKDSPAPMDQDVKDAFFEVEDVVTLDDYNKDFEEFMTHSDSLKKIFMKAHNAKIKGEKIDSTKAAFHFTGLKKCNRQMQFRLKKSRAITSEKRSKVDKTHLSMQNILYETEHLENEITTCVEFNSIHDDIELIEADELRKLQQVTDDDVHEETLERLYWELDSRKKLASQCEQLKSTVTQLIAEIKRKRDFLESHAGQVKDLLDSTKTLQDAFELPFTRENEEYSLAFALPGPLYRIYSLFKSRYPTCKKSDVVTVHIEGEAEAACTFNDSMRKEPTPESEAEEPEKEVSSKKRHKNKTQPDEAVKLPILISHPLTVAVHIALAGPSKATETQLCILFSWLPRLKIISVQMVVNLLENASPKLRKLCELEDLGGLLTSECLLMNLNVREMMGQEPGDESGSDVNLIDCPDLSSLPLGAKEAGNLKKVRVDWDAASTLGRPFVWAQYLAGLAILPYSNPATASAASTTYRPLAMTPSVNSPRIWLEMITQRWQARMLLAEELMKIEAKSISLRAQQVEKLPKNASPAELTEWRRASFKEFEQMERSSLVLDCHAICRHDFIFKGIFRITNNIKCDVWALVPTDYPVKESFLLLDNLLIEPQVAQFPSLSIRHLMEAEAEVNLHWKKFFTVEELSTFDLNILTCQLLHIANLINVLVTAGNAVEILDKNDRPLYVEFIGDRSRSRPLKYYPAVGAFVQSDGL